MCAAVCSWRGETSLTLSRTWYSGSSRPTLPWPQMPNTYGIFSLTRNSAIRSPPFLVARSAPRPGAPITAFSVGLFTALSLHSDCFRGRRWSRADARTQRVQRRQISEGHSRAELGAGAGILAAHDRMHVVAYRV